MHDLRRGAVLKETKSVFLQTIELVGLRCELFHPE